VREAEEEKEKRKKPPKSGVEPWALLKGFENA
jgi:hypothetical protein